MYNQINMSNYRVVAKDFDKRMAKQAGLPLWLRIAHAAGAEMNRSNHAEFGGWLNLADYVRVDGEKMPSRSKIYEGVKKAIELGYLTDESDVFCLVQSGYNTQKAAKGGYNCNHHKIQVLAEENVNMETGEILEAESPVSPSEESEVQNDQVVIPVPENTIVGQDDTTEETPEEKAKRLAETQAVLDEDDFGDYTPDSEPEENNCNDSVTVEIPAGLMSEEAKKLFLDPSFKPGQTEDMRIRWANTYAVPEPVSVTTNTTDDGDEW